MRQEGKPHEAAVEITRWTVTGTETLYRCPRCGWEETEPARKPKTPPEPAQGEEGRRLAS
jgi:hypothetical protein